MCVGTCMYLCVCVCVHVRVCGRTTGEKAASRIRRVLDNCQRDHRVWRSTENHLCVSVYLCLTQQWGRRSKGKLLGRLIF